MGLNCSEKLSLDDPRRIHELREVIRKKEGLKAFYEATYSEFLACVQRSPKEGLKIELGSGGGFANEKIPDLITTDIIAYEGVQQIVDATAMPFEPESLSCILMLNVFHHIPNVERFLYECVRCLKPGGRVLIVDQNKGWISEPILRYAHHEPYLPQAQSWSFQAEGPLSSANGALAWIVFQRDRKKFSKLFPELQIVEYRPHTPIAYWMTGGLKNWSLVNKKSYAAIQGLDRFLVQLSPRLGSFVTIELVKENTITQRTGP